QIGLTRHDIERTDRSLLRQLRVSRQGGTLDGDDGLRRAIELLLDPTKTSTHCPDFAAMRQLLGRYVASERRRDGQRGLAMRREQVEHLLRQNPWVGSG